MMKRCAIGAVVLVSWTAAGFALAGPSGAVRATWERAGFRFTPTVESAFLDAAKAEALAKLRDSGKSLPADFLAWIDSDPVVRTTVYGARRDPAGVLLELRSLELDLGQQVVRKKYTQLALAMAVVHAKEGEKADLSSRPLLVLRIPGDPRQKVDTHAKDRPLDLDDHVINFLIDHAPIEEEVVVGYKDKKHKEPIKEKRRRPLVAADVIASAELEKEFNDYMGAHGQTVKLHIGGETRLNWHSHDLKGVDTKDVKAAYELFRAAYQAKGYLPRQRDAAPTPAQRCAFLIRDNEATLAPGVKKPWPLFPLDAPWPVLTFLAQDAQPLRERQDIWLRYHDKGELHTYGEYVGSIAQNGLFLNARRLTPYAFSTGSIQMMFKDGGVCGVMANIAVRSYSTLGDPACTAGQPGHCALIRYTYDPKSHTYTCRGGQYVTAGDAGTHPHALWTFGDVDARRPMIYHQSVAFAVNDGLQPFLDSMAAHTFYQQLSPEDRAAHGMPLLASTVALCPYDFLAVDDAMARTRPAEVVAFWNTLKPALAAVNKPGCPADGLFNTTVKTALFTRLAKLPVPADSGEARAIWDFLQAEHCDHAVTLAIYEKAIHGLPALLRDTEAAFRQHLASVRNDKSSAAMADTLAAAAAQIGDKNQRRAWALARWQEVQGHELYLGRRNHLTADPSLRVLGGLTRMKPRPEVEQVQSALDSVTERLRTELAGPRTPQGCKQLATAISDVARQLKDAEQKRRWADGLAKLMAGKERYEVIVKGHPRSVVDPCAQAIQKI